MKYKVFLPEAAPNRVYTNSGAISNEDNTFPDYYEDSFIPHEDWHPAEADLPGNLSSFTTSDSIFVFKIPERLIKVIDNLELRKVESYDELFRLRGERERGFSIFSKDFKNFVRKFSISDSISFHDIYVGARNQRTSTINFQRTPSRKVGLHVDTWNDSKISELHKAPNRICINIGEGHRYFLFIDKSLQEISRELGYDSDNSKTNQFLLCREFLSKNPTYPVTALKLYKNEGYIAPTENLIHDGSNFGSDHVDLQITARGHFTPPSNA
jgi:hypothetical protein